jgi:hypothetical protein
VLVEIREKVAALEKQGKTLQEVAASKPGARYDAEWGSLSRQQARLWRGYNKASREFQGKNRPAFRFEPVTYRVET